MTVNYNPRIVTDGLTFCLDAANTKSYSGIGTVWTELTNLSRITTQTRLINGPTYSSANLGSITFDGTNDYAECGLTTGLTGTGSWTMDVWFKLNGVSGVNPNFIIDTDSTPSSYNAIGINTNPRNIVYTTRPSTGGSIITIIGPTLTQGVWYNATSVRNGTTDTKLYINAGLSTTYTGNAGTATQPLVRLTANFDATPTLYSNVSISNVKIYNRALTDAEITQNYNVLRNRYI